MDPELRPGTPEDADGCGAVCYEAFRAVADDHGFPRDIPSRDIAVAIFTGRLSHPGFHVLVAESRGRIVGSVALDERSAVVGVGPVTVDPTVQDGSIGRQLMEAAIHRTSERGCSGLHLLQSTYHVRALSLYTKLGFEVRELLVNMQGPALELRTRGRVVRPATDADLCDCDALCRRVHGYDRSAELAEAVDNGTARVVEGDGRVTGYVTALGFFGHAVGESNADLKALIGSAEAFAGQGFFLPARNGELFRWCLEHGLRVVQPMTLMSNGPYSEPEGVFLPSITY